MSKNSFLMRFLLLFVLTFSGVGVVNGQQSDEQVLEEIEAFQTEQNEHYLSKKKSPLTSKERKAFKGHKFYPIELSYVVTARFEVIEKVDTIILKSSSGSDKYYQPYAKLHFEIGGEKCVLTAFQSFKLRNVEEYKKFLLLPFKDATSGTTSYGGGRYLDIEIPDGNEIVLNFNLAYNPYCAYTMGYNCTVPPKENTLKVPIKSGLMAPEAH